MMLALEVNKLVKEYPGHKFAVHDLNLNVKEGSLFALLGPNGAGKSSLINIIAGTVIKTSGNVNILGHNIDKFPKKASREIGIVPQEIVVDNFFSIYESLEFTAGYYGVSSKKRRTIEILTALDLIDKKDFLPRQLSGGMKRRFLVAKAMVHSPKILILDEPTAGVDLGLREHLWEYIKKLNNEGVTVIITTHYLEEAENLCNEIAFINHGKIIKQDSKENLFTTLGSRQLIIEFTDSIRNKDLSFLDDAKVILDNKIMLEFDSNDSKNLHELLIKIQSNNMTIKDLSIEQANLENIFKKIIND